MRHLHRVFNFSICIPSLYTFIVYMYMCIKIQFYAWNLLC